MPKGKDVGGAARAVDSARPAGVPHATTPPPRLCQPDQSPPRRPSRDGLFTPRDLRTDTALGRALIALEIPDCGCSLDPEHSCTGCRRPRHAPDDWEPCACCRGECECLPPACPHVRDTDHGLSVERWAELLRAFDPSGYDDPPPAAGASVATHAARVALYEERAEIGLAIFSLADAHNRRWPGYREDDEDGIAIEGLPGRRQGEIVSAKRRAA